jgi:hypothetical protein
MNLAALIAELQALAAKTSDGGASIEVKAIYNDRGHYDEAFPIWDACITEERYMNGEPQIVILSCK